jgi:PAT family beta-lactamase induction signal transducer AmpG
MLCFQFSLYCLCVLACWQPENVYLITLGIVVEYFGYGFGFVGIMLFMMQQIAPEKYKMANYAFGTGIMNLE